MSKQIIWGFVLLGILLFLYRVRLILTPFLLAVVLAYILYPLIVMFENRGLSRSAAIVLVYTIFAVVIGGGLWLLLPRLARELDDILTKLPDQARYWERLGQGTLRSLRKIHLPETIQEGVNILVERLEIAFESLASRVAQSLMGAFSYLVAFLISPILAFYFLRDHQAMRERSLQYVPAPWRGQAQMIAGEINRALNGFFRGQLVVSLFVGLFIYAGLAFLKIPYALFIGLLAGLFDIIPYFGPILGFIPAAGFAMLKSPLTVLWVFLLFLAANQLENSIISPKIIGDRVGLHPLVVIFAVLAGGDLLGIAGMLLAVPLAAILRVLLQHFLTRQGPLS